MHFPCTKMLVGDLGSSTYPFPHIPCLTAYIQEHLLAPQWAVYPLLQPRQYN